MRVGYCFVILNYLNYKDTINCVESIKGKFTDPSIDLNIIIVDNCSNNESLRVLEESYKNEKRIYIINSSINCGYARGNNIGINFAKGLNPKYIVVCNSDILFDQKNLLTIIAEKYESNKKIAIIGPRIINKSGEDQNPYMEKRFTLVRIIFLKIYYGKLHIFLKPILKSIKGHFGQKKHVEYRKKILSTSYIYALHGSCLIFTPTYFDYFDGFDPNTFLHQEEMILAENLYHKGLLELFIAETYVTHLEDGASTLAFKEKKNEKVLKYRDDSMIYFVNKILRLG